METTRDIVIIVWGIMSVLTLVVTLLIALFIGLSTKNLVDTINTLVNTGVKPIIDTTEQSLVNVAGTTQFLGDAVVTPIIRLASVVSGLRRGFGVFTGLSNKLKGPRGEPRGRE